MQSLARLLVVEDDAAMNLLLRDFLKGLGYSVDVTVSVKGALELLKSLPPPELPHLILSDVKLGARSGLDLCQQVVQDYPELPVILFSVFDHLESEALANGARRFMKKPFTLEKLVSVLNEELPPVLAKRPTRQSTVK